MLAKKAMLLGMSVLLTAVIGCSSGNSNNEEDSGANNAGTGTTSNTENKDTGSNEAVTYTFGRNINMNDDNIAKLEKATGETIEDNRWTRLFKDELNISVNYKLTSASGGDYNQSLKLAMASGDLPDIFQVSQTSDLSQLMQAGAVEEMGPLYDQYGSDLLKSIIEGETKQVFEPATYKGKIYAIPAKMPSTNGYNHLWIREDWLIKLGLERPKTIDDVHNIAKAFAEQDPDGNNKKDTYGLELDSDFRNNTSGLFWAFGAIPAANYWLDKDGQAVRGFVQPEMKKPLALLNQMYEEGLIDKEFGTKDNAKAMESAVAGKTGMFYGPHWMAFTAEKTLANDPNAKWIVVPLPSESGDPVQIPLTNAADGYLVVKKGTPHPENLVKMMNVYVEQLFGEGADFSKYFGEGGVDGIWWMSPVYTLDPKIDLLGHQGVKKAMEEGDTASLSGSAEGFYKSIQEGSWPIAMMFGPKDTPFAYVDMTYPDQVRWNAYTGAPTPTEVTRGSSMDELIETTLTSMIQGKTDIDSGFDKMVDEWNKLGGDKVTQEVNDALKQ